MPFVRFIDPQFISQEQFRGDTYFGYNDTFKIYIDEYNLDSLGGSGLQIIGDLAILHNPYPGPSNHYGFNNQSIFFTQTGSPSLNNFRLLDKYELTQVYGNIPHSTLGVINGTIEGGSSYTFGLTSPIVHSELMVEIRSRDIAPTVLNVQSPGTVELGTNAPFTFSVVDSLADRVIIRSFETGSLQVANFGRNSVNQDFVFNFNTSGLDIGSQTIDFTVSDNDGFTVPVSSTLNVIDTTAPNFVNNFFPRTTVISELDLLQDKYLGSARVRDADFVNLQFISGFFATKGEVTETRFSDNQVDFAFTLTKGYELQDGVWNNTLLATDNSGNERFIEFSVTIENSAPALVEDSFEFSFDGVDELFVNLLFQDSVVDDHTGFLHILDENGELVTTIEEGIPTISPTTEEILGRDVNGDGEISGPAVGQMGGTYYLSEYINLEAGLYNFELEIIDSDGASLVVSDSFTVEGDEIDHTLLDSTYSNTIDITQDNLPDSRFDRLITTAMVYGSSEYNVEGVETVFISDDADNLMEATSRRVIQRDYNRDGFDDLRVYIGRSDLADIATIDSEELFLSGTNSLGETFVTSGLNGADFELV